MAVIPWMDVLLIQALAALLVWAAISDLRRFVIPNRVSLSIALLYPAYVLSAPQPVDWPVALAIAVATFLAGAFAFSRGWFGGGDVKLLAAASLWAGPVLLPTLLFVTGVTGGLLGIVALAKPCLARITSGWRVTAPASSPACVPSRTNIPYGVAISAGGCVVALQLLLAR